ncbi:MAG: phosphatase PAP2 family protein [Pedosphaera sp.]|nr:phosphatase PAP2 family protein [Pedosphaera sp.]
MRWIESLDVGGFRFVHESLRNSALDLILPFFSWNALFVPALILAAIWLVWRGGSRGRIFLFMMVLAIVVGDGIICNSIKHIVARPRPFAALADVQPLVGKGTSGSMPSSHVANWFAAATLTWLFWRRRGWMVLGIACVVAFSRVYLGVHYPSDVLVGAALGVGYSFALVWVCEQAWQFTGRKWFPLWHDRMTSLRNPDAATKTTSTPLTDAERSQLLDRHWIRLGYVLIGLLLLIRLAYLASGRIELSEDEAYQWVWSKHLAASYYSKPPMIAYAQFLGTQLWGDTAFGVRFLSPVIAAILACSLLGFFAREVSAKAGFWLALILSATPLLAVGSTLLTIDPLSVLFWTAAMLSGWRAVRDENDRQWSWTGLWLGLGFLSKYIALGQIACFGLFFLLWKPARLHLRHPGPYLGLVVMIICTIPVIWWNWKNDWITVTHLANRGGLDRAWQPTIRFTRDFLLAEAGLLNPVFFIAAIWAAVVIVKNQRRDRLEAYLLCMGTPLFAFYAIFTLRSAVLPNWIAPAVVPMFCLMVVYWSRRIQTGSKAPVLWLAAGVAFGLGTVVLLHDTGLVSKVLGFPLPARINPLNRVHGWNETARVVGEARTKLEAGGKAAFVIGGHYGITGQLSFYMPEAKAQVTSREPLVYYQSSAGPDNQFYFWPGYQHRKGQNAIYVRTGKSPEPAPERLTKEFESVTDLGLNDILDRNQVVRRIQLFECRGLR